MLFSSAIFLFLFLPFVLLVYYFTPKKLKNLCLLLVSLAFYSFGEGELVLLIIVSTLIDFSAGIIIEKGKKRLGLLLSIIANVSFLSYFKYASFAYENFYSLAQFLGFDYVSSSIPNIILPLGISFFTFQTMSYTIDVYRGNIKANHNIIDFATYVTLFPQLIAGPIVRYIDIHKQLQHRTQNISQFSEGVERFIIGLAKKMIIANNLAYVADAAFEMPLNDLSTLAAWIGIMAYTFQIYFDFSGYSDMAIGLGKMFGFDFLENFNYPYISKSIREFWRRWHISLSTWFRDYLYISLGGNRKGNTRTYINLTIVFLITGLWHGASWNFIFWGAFHGFFLIIERIGLNSILKRIYAPIAHIYTLLVIVISWVFFRANTLTEAFQYLEKMFLFYFVQDINYTSFYITKEVLFIFVLAFVFSIPYSRKILNKKFNSINFRLFKKVLVVFIFIISIIYIAIDTYNPFIYFRF